MGYEDGGLLTDAIRKTPNCVLLLDEIEKAHPDVFNILLQVMDYAVLTDNKGRKADCRHVVLIMTSNAGAQYARQASIGFNSQVTAGEAMLKQVKKTFKPEFINRLSATVVFHDMDRPMASLILDKKLGELGSKLYFPPGGNGIEPGSTRMAAPTGFYSRIRRPGDGPRDSRPLETLADARNSVRYIKGRRKSPRASGKRSIETTTRNRITIWSFN